MTRHSYLIFLVTFVAAFVGIFPQLVQTTEVDIFVWLMVYSLGVLGAFFKTKNPCSHPDLSTYNNKSHTLARVAASIVRCLATDPSTVDKIVNFEDPYDFGEFLYQ